MTSREKIASKTCRVLDGLRSSVTQLLESCALVSMISACWFRGANHCRLDAPADSVPIRIIMFGLNRWWHRRNSG